jgi:hypothetical protein
VNTIQKKIRTFNILLIVYHPTTFQDICEHKSGVYPTKLDVCNKSDGAKRDIDILGPVI